MLQLQLRHNTEELQDYLKGLESWEEEMKAKDRGLSKNKPILKEVRRVQDKCILRTSGYVVAL